MQQMTLPGMIPKSQMVVPYSYSNVRIAEYIAPEDVLSLIRRKVTRFGVEVKTDSRVLAMFKRNQSHKHCCVDCGAKLTHFHIERNRGDLIGSFRFSPYATVNGKEVPLTWDHIIPKALGGSNHIDNSQVMCRNCNSNKGETITQPGLELIHTSSSVVSEARLIDAIRTIHKQSKQKQGLLEILCCHIVESLKTPNAIKQRAAGFVSC